MREDQLRLLLTEVDRPPVEQAVNATTDAAGEDGAPGPGCKRGLNCLSLERATLKTSEGRRARERGFPYGHLAFASECLALASPCPRPASSCHQPAEASIRRPSAPRKGHGRHGWHGNARARTPRHGAQPLIKYSRRAEPAASPRGGFSGSIPFARGPERRGQRGRRGDCDRHRHTRALRTGRRVKRKAMPRMSPLARRPGGPARPFPPTASATRLEESRQGRL